MEDHGPIESNPVFIALTYAERREYEEHQEEIKKSWPVTHVAEKGPQLSHLISDIMVEEGEASSGAASISFSFILGLLSAIVALLFFLV